MKTEVIALFRWEDAAGKVNWHEKDELLGTLSCTSCGLLIHEDEEVISIGLERFDDGGWRETLTVPKRLILGKVIHYDIPISMKEEM